MNFEAISNKLGELHPSLGSQWVLALMVVAAGFLLHMFLKFFAIVIWFLVFLFVLQVYGINIGAVLASAGILGIAIGLAAKETLADILSGIFIISDQPIRIGDRIKLDRIGAHWGGWGDVLDIGLRRTKIRNPDGVVVNYPNSTLATSVITNFSDQRDEPIRARIRFQVGYHEDIDKVTVLATKVINDTEGTLEGTAEVVVRSLWDEESGALGSGVLMEGRYKITDVKARTRIRSRVLTQLLSAFKEHDIEFGHAIFEMAPTETKS